MLDIAFIRENAELVQANSTKRGFDVDVNFLLELDARRRSLTTDLEASRKEANKIAERAKLGGVSENLRAEGAAIKTKISSIEAALRDAQTLYEDRLHRVPNILDPRVPLGDEDAYSLKSTWGEKRDFKFKPKPHEELGESLNIIDIDSGVRLAGSRFYVMKNEGVLLRSAMMHLFLSLLDNDDWEIVSPPYLASDRTLFTAGYLPFNDKDNYRIEGQDLSLIGTSEQAILGFHMGQTLPKLPKLYLGDSMCYRTEVGAAGRDTKGIIRVHQFYKFEQIVFCDPLESEKWHLKCLENEERFLQSLDIPYRVIVSASGDIAAPGKMKYDIEAWLPSQGRYREVTSNTNLGDFQCRRGGIRFTDQSNRKVFPHTISATGFCDRHIIAVLENYQSADGSVAIPEALQRFMGGRKVIRPR